MGLTERLARFAAGKPRALLAAVPGGTAARVRVEAELDARGWRPATSPANAGLLVVCGEPGAELERAVGTVWSDLPNPRRLTRIPAAASARQIAALLDDAVAGLADLAAQRADAAQRVAAGPWLAAPHDLTMADRAPDRDGLKLDQLHVPLGPVLPHWPAGLVVHTTLQGDVVQAAEVGILTGTGGVPYWDEPWWAALAGEQVTRGAAERRRAAAHLDSLGRLLAVAGWRWAAVRAGRLRDDLLADRPATGFAGLSAKVARSRTLRWMMGDFVAARVRTWVDETRASLARLDDTTWLADAVGPRGPVAERPSVSLVERLPDLVTGQELAAARLTIAALDPDVEQLAPGAVRA